MTWSWSFGLSGPVARGRRRRAWPASQRRPHLQAGRRLGGGVSRGEMKDM